MYSKIDGRSFSIFYDFVIDIFSGFIHNFLNTGRVNSSILNQSMERKSGNFSPDRVKTRNNYGLWGIINYQLNPGCSFNGSDVSTFPSNDFTLDVVTFEVKNRNTIFNGLLMRSSLNGGQNNFPRFFGCSKFCFFHHVFDVGCSFCTGLIFKAFYQLIPCFLQR